MASEKVFPVINDSSQEPSGLTGILRQAIRLSFRNGKLVVSIITLVLLPIYLLVSLHSLFAGPLIEELEDQQPQLSFSRLKKDAEILLCLESIFLFAFSLVSLLGMIMTIYYTSITYTGKSVSLKELLLRIKATWKKPVITWLYILSLTLAYIIFVAVLMAALSLFTGVGAMPIWIILLGCLAAVFYIYLAPVWILGLVISVVNEDCYGVKAIEKAGKVIRGRKVQGFVLMLFLFLLSSPISVSFYLNVSDDDLGIVAQFAFGFGATVLFCLAKLFTFLVFTVFYFECKKSHGEKVEMELGMGTWTGYYLVPNNLHVNASIP